MKKILSLSFVFKGKIYQSLVRLLRRENRQVLRVTIMDGELEKALTGANTFEVQNGFVAAELCPPEDHRRDLQLAIIGALDECFANTPLKDALQCIGES
jgi:hypothetical protein